MTYFIIIIAITFIILATGKINLLSLGFPTFHAIECRIRGYFFKRKLKKISKFIIKHKIYPVNLNEELLNIWGQD